MARHVVDCIPFGNVIDRRIIMLMQNALAADSGRGCKGGRGKGGQSEWTAAWYGNWQRAAASIGFSLNSFCWSRPHGVYVILLMSVLFWCERSLAKRENDNAASTLTKIKYSRLEFKDSLGAGVWKMVPQIDFTNNCSWTTSGNCD